MLKIRLRRMGARNAPFYRVVVSDSRRRPTGVAVEEIGYYDPTKNPATVKIDRDRVDHWVSNGAQVSHTVQRLMRQAAGSPSPVSA
jgi:small subunit ribosomal protein S16